MSILDMISFKVMVLLSAFMLHFYLIPDDAAKPNFLKQANLEQAGKIKLEEFKELQRQGFMGERFDFWTDFRWNSQQVRQKAELIVKKLFYFGKNKSR